MTDASLLWGTDLDPSPVGDIAVVNDAALGQQRLLRRLLTNPGDYLWQPSYGAGLGQFVGRPYDVSDVKAAIRSQIFQEKIVARTPEPKIDAEVSQDGTVYVKITYVESTSGSSQLLSFSVSN